LSYGRTGACNAGRSTSANVFGRSAGVNRRLHSAGTQAGATTTSSGAQVCRAAGCSASAGLSSRAAGTISSTLSTGTNVRLCLA